MCIFNVCDASGAVFGKYILVMEGIESLCHRLVCVFLYAVHSLIAQL